MPLLINLITFVEGGLSRPFDLLPRKWRAYRFASSTGGGSGALVNRHRRRVGSLSSW
jgi:hypothetical protein